ncbi:MAG: Stp1/IreP family PP2C-type Ser/Thr phosphatase [Bacteroidetes bacterium]|nr:MAG: Stp1/IreP family PP2C-type Ser/Thr phosphatase [Bacteroidota bacterium]
MTKTIILRNFDFISLTDKGVERKINEDYLAYFDTFNGHIFVVCDGMGGHQGGDIASETAVEAIGDFFNATYHKNPFEAIENAISFANQKVYNRSKQSPELYGMGTTIIFVLIRDDRVYYGHAGDSRLYAFSQNSLKQLTRDHSYVNQLVDRKIITEKEAISHPRRNEITRALGLADNIEPEVTNSAYLPNEKDILLLCSDGLNNMVSDSQIKNILTTEKNIEEKASELINAAIKNGGIDNISVQLIRFHNINHQYTPIKINNWGESILKKYLLNKWAYFIGVLVIFFIVSIILLNKKDLDIPSEEYELIISKGHKTTNDGLLMIYPYKIKKSDNYELISEKFKVGIPFLKSLNPNMYEFIEGMHLKVPIQEIYIVQGDDDIQLISDQFNINLIDIMQVNEFCDYKLTVGRELIIPLAGNKIETLKKN